MKNQLFILGLASLLLLSACSNDSQNLNDLESKDDLSSSELDDLNKDKKNTVNLLSIDKSKQEKLNQLTEKMDLSGKELVNYFKFDKHKYYQAINYNKKVDIDEGYIIFVKDTEKVNKLYKYALKELINSTQSNVIIYTDKPEKLNDLSNSNVKINKLSDVKFPNSDLTVDEIPSMFIINNSKVKMNLVGYYDFDTMSKIIYKFGGKM